MKGATYIGPIESLRGQHALVLPDKKIGPGGIIAQFDDLSSHLSHGWHPFPESDFRYDPESE